MKYSYDIVQIKEGIALGNQSAYKALFDQYYDRLLKLALMITGSKELSEEIISDVFIAVWRRRQNIGVIDNLTVYLYVAVKNTSLNYLSRLTKTEIVSIDELDFAIEQTLVCQFIPGY